MYVRTKLVGFILFFFFGSSLIGIASRLLYLFFIQASLPLVITSIVLFASVPFLAMLFYKIKVIKKEAELEEIMVGGLMSVLLLIFCLTMVFGLRYRVEKFRELSNKRTFSLTR